MICNIIFLQLEKLSEIFYPEIGESCDQIFQSRRRVPSHNPAPCFIFNKLLTNLIILIELTSWWDVYETFVNILKMVEEPHLYDPLLANWRSTTSGISLFHPIPERNCSSAGISGTTNFFLSFLFFFNLIRKRLSLYTYSTN